MRHRILTVSVSLLALVVAACGAADEAAEPSAEAPVEAGEAEAGPPRELLVVTTTSILGDIVGTLVGGDGVVEVIMPPGADPHTFQPSAADGALLRDADLVVANGLQLEENLVSMLEAAVEEGIRVFELAVHLGPIEFGGDHARDHGNGHDDDHGHDHDHGHEEAHGHGHEDDDHAHDHGPEDPHVWFDPVRMADGVRLLAVELAEVAPWIERDDWDARGDAYASEILAVHEQLEEMFAGIERRVLVTNHDALGYLAHRYEFEVLGTIIPGSSTQAETDPRSFARLADLVERVGVPAIFAENTDSTRLAEQLASEVVGRGDVQVEVVGLYTDALGEPGSGAETYLGLLLTTAQRITDALS